MTTIKAKIRKQVAPEELSLKLDFDNDINDFPILINYRSNNQGEIVFSSVTLEEIVELRDSLTRAIEEER
jgi:hypothetical protein|tara:strand:- start:42 stop:251 length:210 start_codon:yes stop_codon:yes gene_type:complete